MVIVLLTLLAIIVLFSVDKYPPDSAVLLAIIILVVTGVLTPEEAFQGFGSDFIIILASIFVISAALQHNGVVDYFSTKLAETKISNYPLLLAIIMIPVGILSAFMNNTTVAAVTVPPILGLSKKIGIAPSKLLMPMAFASLVGGTCTLIGTSTNIAGNNFLIANNLPPIGMFEFFPIGLTLLGTCVLIFVLLGDRILPNRSGTSEEAGAERLFYSHFWVAGEDKLLGFTGSMLKVDEIFYVKTHLLHGKISRDPEIPFGSGDQVFIKASSHALKTFFHKYQLKKSADIEHETKLAEMMVLPSSFVANSTLRETGFYQSTGLRVTGLFRKNFQALHPHKDVIIKVGDILLVEGNSESIHQVRVNNDFVILNDEEKNELPHLKKGFFALTIFLLSIFLSSTGVLPMSIAFLAGALLIASLNIIPSRAVYNKVDWRLIILIGGMTAFGTAVKKTGADQFLASLITANLSFAPNSVICLAFMLITVALTQPMSNAAAALVVLPVALQTALDVGADPRSFCIAVILSASISMITPFEPASLLVLNPGRYKISDFFKIGGPLTLLCLMIILAYMLN